MTGITTELGRFDGIAEDPAVKKDLIRVTGTFDELLEPSRGWTYLFEQSANYASARTLALRSPECPKALIGPRLHDELAQIVPAVATAYLQEDSGSLQTYADPGIKRIFTTSINCFAISTCERSETALSSAAAGRASVRKGPDVGEDHIAGGADRPDAPAPDATCGPQLAR
jgi:hypothetical protein